MKWKTASGKLKDIKGVHNYLVDWTAKQGSEFSTEVLGLLQPYWGKDIVFAELPVAGSKMRYDFVNQTKKIIVETDGQQHGSYNKHMHQGSVWNYQAQVTRDLDKDALAEKNGFRMVRIKPEDLPKLRVSIKAWFKAYHDITL
jgi:hypothetical protein